MAYVRFTESDVYAYPSTAGLVCVMCNLQPLKEDEVTVSGKVDFTMTYPQDFITTSRREFIKHLEEHINNGSVNLEHAIERLENEIEELGDDAVSDWPIS